MIDRPFSSLPVLFSSQSSAFFCLLLSSSPRILLVSEFTPLMFILFIFISVHCANFEISTERFQTEHTPECSFWVVIFIYELPVGVVVDAVDTCVRLVSLFSNIAPSTSIIESWVRFKNFLTCATGMSSILSISCCNLFFRWKFVLI